MAEKIGRQTGNLEVSGSSSVLTTAWSYSTRAFSATLVNSQLVCLLSVGISNPTMSG